MVLKVYNRRRDILCTYCEGVRLPSPFEIDSMQEEGYVFEVDGKVVSAKKLKELIKTNV